MAKSELEHLERRLERLEILMRKHNPPGFGYDGAFGHRSSGQGASASLSQEAITPSYWLAQPRMRRSEFAQSHWCMDFGTNAQTMYNIYLPASATSVELSSIDRTDDVFYTLNVFRGPNLSTTAGSTAGCGMQADGTNIFITYSDGSGLVIDKATVASGNFAAMTIAGANAPANTANGAYLMGLLSTSRMAVWHQGVLYWGDISGTTVTFSDASTTLPSGFTLPTTDLRYAAMASDGTNYILVNSVNSPGDLLKNVLIIDDTGSVQNKYLDIWTPGGKDDGSNNVSRMGGIVKIESLWCPIFSAAESGTQLCQSWELSAHTDDA